MSPGIAVRWTQAAANPLPIRDVWAPSFPVSFSPAVLIEAVMLNGLVSGTQTPAKSIAIKSGTVLIRRRPGIGLRGLSQLWRRVRRGWRSCLGD
jgi:hypothetical protein